MKTTLNGVEVECSVEEFKELLKIDVLSEAKGRPLCENDLLRLPLDEETPFNRVVASDLFEKKVRKYVKSGLYSKKKELVKLDPHRNYFTKFQSKTIVAMRKQGFSWKDIGKKVGRSWRSCMKHYRRTLKGRK